MTNLLTSSTSPASSEVAALAAMVEGFGVRVEEIDGAFEVGVLGLSGSEYVYFQFGNAAERTQSWALACVEAVSLAARAAQGEFACLDLEAA
jgi:hypothetical protein